MNFPDFEKLVKQRRSIRYYSDKPVSKDDVLKLLEVAHLSPSVENAQPWHFHVIFNQDMKRKLMSACCYGNFVDAAGVFIVVSCDHSHEFSMPEVVWNPKELEFSCMAAMMHVILGATAMGLGSCWVSLHHGQVHEFMKLPREHTVVGGVMLGHFKAGEEKSGEHFERKPLSGLVTVYD
ncbi:MAG: nitroreductase family protein [Candidatus Peribacteraceae bacterium]|nr:nitroreductase family protein [Candidatus Peribacteraceae bacterium]